MRSSVTLLLCLSALTCGWADTPPASETPSASQPSSEVSASAPATTARAPASSSTPSPTVLVTAQLDKKWRAKGYKPVFRHGETLYCRREAVLGSHFESNVCRTSADLENAERSGQYYLEQNQHTSSPRPKGD